MASMRIIHTGGPMVSLRVEPNGLPARAHTHPRPPAPHGSLHVLILLHDALVVRCERQVLLVVLLDLLGQFHP